MKYLSVQEVAKRWNVSESCVHNYCVNGMLPNAFVAGKTWVIPETTEKPRERAKKKPKTENFVLPDCTQHYKEIF